MAERPREEGGRDGRASKRGSREVGMAKRPREEGGRDGRAFKGGGW